MSYEQSWASVMYYSLLLVDVDGVALIDGAPCGDASEAIRYLAQRGCAVKFVTNNVTTPRSRLENMLSGVVGCDGVHLIDPIDLLVQKLPYLMRTSAPWLVIGTDVLLDRLHRAGVNTDYDPGHRPGLVLVSSIVDLRYEALVAAAREVANDVPGFATGMDRWFRWSRRLWPGVGPLARHIEYATGRRLRILGKPNPGIFRMAASKVPRDRVLVIGDDLSMDIAGGRRAGYDTALIASDVTALCRPRRVVSPTVTAADWSELVEFVLRRRTNG